MISCEGFERQQASLLGSLCYHKPTIKEKRKAERASAYLHQLGPVRFDAVSALVYTAADELRFVR